MDTTTIGSFPPEGGDAQEAIRKVIALQKRYGIDILSDGEQRMDMIGYFSSSIPGLAFQNGLSSIKGKITPLPDPENFSKVRDLKFIRSLIPEAKVKVSVTGPITLGFMCSFGGVSRPYSNMKDPKLYTDLAEALRSIVGKLSDLGAYIQIDEPGLSQGFMEPKDAVKIIDSVAVNAEREKTSIHVCGNLKTYNILEHLVRLGSIDILSHAFAGKSESGNIDLLSKKAFIDNGKKLGLGCISVTPTTIDAVDRPQAVADLIKKAKEKLGEENIAYLHPDCGLRASPLSVVEKILENFQKGIKESKN